MPINPKTEQHFATLEALLEEPLYFSPPYHEDGGIFRPFIWNASELGKFSPLSFIESQNWIQRTDLDIALERWKQHEESHTVGLYDLCQEYLEGEIDACLNEDAKQNRLTIYRQLQKLFEIHLKEIYAYKVSYHSDYSLFIIIGKSSDNRWLGIAPSVPHETPDYIQDAISCIAISARENDVGVDHASEHPIVQTVDSLGYTKIYGWYGGGYENVHKYGLHYALGNTERDAIEHLLLKSGLVERYSFECFKLGEQIYDCGNLSSRNKSARYQHLNRFLFGAFASVTAYRICFWDYELIYLLGDLDSEDKVGICLHSQYTLNP